jgi:hypothetical protein
VVPIADKGGKTRNIAIADSWTQLALNPLHNTAMSILKSLENDYSLRQEQAVSSLKRANSPKYSFDLSNATDRFPIWLQKRVVEVL